MKREFTDENGVHHITHDCTPEQLKEFQERIQLHKFRADLREIKEMQGYDPEHTTYQEHIAWLNRIREKELMKQFERDHPPKLIVRIWDWLTEPKISFVAMFAGTLAGQLLIKLVNWGLRTKEEEIAALEKLKVKACGNGLPERLKPFKACGGVLELTYIGNGLSERLKPFGIEGELVK